MRTPKNEEMKTGQRFERLMEMINEGAGMINLEPLQRAEFLLAFGNQTVTVVYEQHKAKE